MKQALADALSERGYEKLTAVQEAVTDPDLNDADLLVSAQTGSGKTVGFGLAIAPTLLGDDETLGQAGAPLALVVAPTRELAFQVMRELQWLYAKAGARVATCIGGMDARDERRALERGAHIVVGTPGRLVDHIQRGSLAMESLRAIVLDEADEMLDLGFREDLEFMLGEAPEDRRTLLFSATVPPMIARLAEQFQRDAVRVNTASSGSQHADISYQALRVADVDAENAIVNVLRFHDAKNAIVFANTRAVVARLTARLSNRGFSVVSLSGELSQDERTHALQAMRDGRARVCVATDVAARGIDLPGLELVIHAELPSRSEALLHRSGRTGRAGSKGISALIVTPKIAKKTERLLQFAKVEAEWTTPPSADDVLRRDEERLLADPVWEEEVTPERAEAAAKLLDLHGPEKIAAAYLALYSSRLSAPEDLSDPGKRPERKERKPFGPSKWFALSVGRDDRAEPRWLLPLLCNAGGIDKTAIGAIRIQKSETFVELSEAHAAGFMDSIGDGTLEKDVKVRALDAPPVLEDEPRQRPPRPRYDRDDRPRPEKRAPYKPRDRAPRADAPASADAPKSDAPRPDRKPYQKRDRDDAKGGDRSHGKPYSRDDGKRGDRPYGKPRDRDSDSRGDRSYGKPRDRDGDARGKKPYGKPRDRDGEKPYGKPKGKSYGKPDTRKGPPKSGSAPRKSDAMKARAADTSKRFTPPKARKGAGGNEPPRRG